MKHSKYADLKHIALSTFRDCQERQGFSKLQAFAFSFEHLGLYVDGDDPSERLFALTALFMTARSFDVPHGDDPDYSEYVLVQLRASYQREAEHVLAEVAGLPGNEELTVDIGTVRSAYGID